MQSSQRIATAMPRATSSLVLKSSALGARAACARPEKAFMTSGAPLRRLRNLTLSSFVYSGHLVIRGFPFACARGARFHIRLFVYDITAAGRSFDLNQ